MHSSWSDPSFIGNYLPATRHITDSGFDATWQVLELNRDYGQYWSDQQVRNEQIQKTIFGIKLYQPADVYQQNNRVIKYAVLFIILTFATFFLFEVFFKLEVHPLQYFMVGGALSTFYLLLIAFSEHISFSISYLLASIGLILLISSYSATILKQYKRGIIIGALLTLFYGFLYILLKSEQNALLLGALAIFALLSVLMYITRNIDWYNFSKSEVTT